MCFYSNVFQSWIYIAFQIIISNANNFNDLSIDKTLFASNRFATSILYFFFFTYVRSNNDGEILSCFFSITKLDACNSYTRYKRNARFSFSELINDSTPFEHEFVRNLAACISFRRFMTYIDDRLLGANARSGSIIFPNRSYVADQKPRIIVLSPTCTVRVITPINLWHKEQKFR